MPADVIESGDMLPHQWVGAVTGRLRHVLEGGQLRLEQEWMSGTGEVEWRAVPVVVVAGRKKGKPDGNAEA